MSRIRVFIAGGNGFIGSEIAKAFESDELEVIIPGRNEIFNSNSEKDIIIYCAGYGDCSKPGMVVESNVSYLQKIIEQCNFSKLIYISSTRLYINSEYSSEASNILIDTNDNRRLFNLTKLVAEECCIKSIKNTIIVRPSNVYGNAFESKLFLPMIVKNAIQNKKIDMYVNKEYNKDYISVKDVAHVVKHLALFYNGAEQIFNVASGINTTAEEIANIIQSKIDCEVVWHENSTNENFPVIDISRVKELMSFEPSTVIDDLSLMINEFSERFSSEI